MAISKEHYAEIDDISRQSHITKRTLSKGMEAHLYKPYPILDNGFVRVIDYMGNDEAITQAARVSYGTGTKTVSSDEKLIRYLMRNWHSTPFEMCEVKFHVKLPIFVARQWIRHRTANVNEYSARYSVLDREFYIPASNQLKSQSKQNHQGRESVLSGDEAARVLEILKSDSTRAYDNYEAMISERDQSGLARELARMNLPMNIYTQWYWKIDLHNLFHFLKLRADAHAQYEIRVYADAIADIVKDWTPIAYFAFEDYRLNAAHFSKTALIALRKMLKGEAVSFETSGMSQSEWLEFQTILKDA